MGYRNALFFCPYLCTRNPDGTPHGLPEGCECFLFKLIIKIMRYEMKIFESPEFGRIRTVSDERGEPWFCLADVCKVLGLKQNGVVMRLEKGVISTEPLSTRGGTQMANFVSEDGLYDVILDSRKPSARAFRKWVTSEVLPQIRRTGGYVPLEEQDDEKTILAKAVRILNRTLEQKDVLLRRKEELLEEQRPKVEFADALTAGDGCILISELAKLLTRNGFVTGRTRLYRWMREHGYIFKRSTEPIQMWVERGIFAQSVTVIKTNHGTEERVTTKVTGKGQEYFLRLLCNQ
ncbi:phage antirepressor KilAC domain-containing protein [uncultured Prevotella sp.]|uniref:phage antirepressor KilAC domain-containing protein n=1 Tax=uncultured Prevotella sp. TaxID=159272 RepID=UPI00266CB7AD|nr:phage antirepressor KilAC domain-containing protein [uncultured Prevotella sp.]